MSGTVSEMTKEELVQVIGMAVEQKLIEILGDPDEGLTLQTDIRQRLIQQQKAVADGERGLDITEVVKKLDLD